MKTISRTALAIATAGALWFPLTSAFAASVAIQNLPSSTTLFAKSNINFNLVSSGFSYPIYHVTDSFVNTTATVNNIDGGGKFSWTPIVQDVGTHTFSFSITDNDGNYAVVTQTVTVLPPPSIAIISVSPGNQVMPGSKITFLVSPTGFTTPTYVIGDVATNQAILTNNLDTAGNFSWTPTISDNGEHKITVYASDALGHHSEASVTIRVGAGPSLSVASLLPGTNIQSGQTVTFSIAAANFLPTGYSVSDSFSGKSSITNNNLTLSGQFSWIPQASDVGMHNLSILGQVGAYGTSATTSLQLVVLGPGGVLPAPVATSSQQSAGTSTALTTLLAQLAKLQGAIATQSGGAPTQSSAGLMFTSTLKPGSSGDEVLQLQNLLVKEGFLTATANGYYGVGTTAGVKKFQSAHGLEPIGFVGPATRIALNALGTATISTPVSAVSATKGSKYVFEHFMGVGDDDPDVLELQMRLSTLGFLTAAPTGYYGGVTETAVKKFQKARGLSATGYVGKDTRAALNQ